MELRIDTRTISSYKSLMQVIRKALIATWNNVTFSASSPQVTESESVSTPIVTYRLIEKTPGEFNNTKEIKPRLRETIIANDITINNPDGEDVVVEPGGAIEVWGQMFDYSIEFRIYGKSAEEADEIAYKFQQFMFKYTGYFKKMGVSEMLFLRMAEDNDDTPTKTGLTMRKMAYLFRIDEIVGIKVPTIENVIIEPDVHESTIALVVDVYIRDYLEEKGNK